MKRSFSSEGANMDSTFKVAPAGDYRLLISKITDTKNDMPWKTKNGDDYVQVECEIDDAGDFLGKKVWYGVTFMDDKSRPGAGMSLHFLKSIGEPYEGDFIVDTDNWVDKRFRVKLKIGKDLEGRPKNEIAYVIDESTQLPSDEVPF